MWLCIILDRQINVTNVTVQCASSQAGGLRTRLKMHSWVKTNKCNQCDFISFYKSALRKHLKIHSGEKPNKCNQCDFAPSQAGHLRAHLKKHSLLKCNSFIVHGNFLIHPFLVKSYNFYAKSCIKIDKCCQLLLSKDIISYWLLSVKS